MRKGEKKYACAAVEVKISPPIIDKFLRVGYNRNKKKEKDKEMAKEEITLGEFEVAEDMMLDGLKIVQDVRLYRFTSDSVLLSKFVTPKKGEITADFCAGSGIVGFHFFALNRDKMKNLPVYLFELQPSLLQLAEKTAKLNGFDNFFFECGRLQEIDEKFREKFSLVLCNPPYESGGFDNETYEKAICRKEITVNLKEIVDVAAFALKFGGRLALVHRADRLAEIIYTLKQRNLETKKIQFVSGKTGAKPYLVLIEAVKGGKPSTQILPTLVNEKK